MTVSPAVLSVLDLEYVYVPVSVKKSGSYINPTSDTVTMAFTAGGVDPVGGDWKSASWETDSTTTPPTYSARCLVGPGGSFTPTAGTYEVWVKVTDSPEIPVLRSGTVVVN